MKCGFVFLLVLWLVFVVLFCMVLIYHCYFFGFSLSFFDFFTTGFLVLHHLLLVFAFHFLIHSPVVWLVLLIKGRGRCFCTLILLCNCVIGLSQMYFFATFKEVFDFVHVLVLSFFPIFLINCIITVCYGNLLCF